MIICGLRAYKRFGAHKSLRSNYTKHRDGAYAPTNETKRFPGWIHPQPPVLGVLQFLCSDWDRESIKWKHLLFENHLFQKPTSPAGSKQSSHHSRGTHADSRTDSRGGAPQHLSLHVLIHCSVVRCCFRTDQILGARTCSRSSEFSNFCARIR